MVQKTTIVLTDDLDGGPAAETVSFGLDSSLYEVELSEVHAARLRDLLRTYIEAGRRVPSVSQDRHRSTHDLRSHRVRNDPADLVAVRRWAADNGYTVRAMGRVPRHVWVAWRAATGH